MSDHLESLGKLIASNPELQKAALSGLSKAVQEHITNNNLRVDPKAVEGLGKLGTISPGDPIADDYVLRAVSSVLAVVKVKVIDLANDVAQMHELQTRINSKISGMNLNLNKINR